VLRKCSAKAIYTEINLFAQIFGSHLTTCHVVFKKMVKCEGFSTSCQHAQRLTKICLFPDINLLPSVSQLSKQSKRKKKFPALPLASVTNTEIENFCRSDIATLSQTMLSHHLSGRVLPVISSELQTAFYPNTI
jgi:hypothetical protein